MSTLSLPVGYETAKYLPIGTLIEFAEGTGGDAYWNGQQHVKTGESTWAIVYTSTAPERVAEMVITGLNNVSPCPPRTTGVWLIGDASGVFEGMRAKLATLDRQKSLAEQKERNTRDELDRIRSFVAGDICDGLTS